MDYTPEQRAAIETLDRNVIVIAGAGSGKTRVLADRFVALLGAHPEWPVAALAAITFTDKAALELRSRIRGAFESRIALSQDAHERHFWRERAAGLDGARIGTIHSLCALIVRANAAQIGIDPGFEVLDEGDTAIMQDTALDETLVALAQTPAAALFGYYSLPELRWALITTFEWDAANLPTAEMLDPAHLRTAWEKVYLADWKVVIDRLRADQQLQEAFAWQPNPPPEQDDKLFAIWSEVRAILADSLFAADRSPADDGRQMYQVLERCAARISLNVGSDKNWRGQLKTAKAHLGTLREKIKSALESIGAPIGELDDLAAALIPHWAAAIRLLHETYRHLKDTDHALDFADLERLARNLLRNEAVCARYRGLEFQHILVDEFQDTNAAQREIVYGLTGYRPGSLFVVGDPKQAIYGFRGADVAVFEQVRAEIVASGGLEIPLSTSFRAHEALVGAQNQVFSMLLDTTADSIPNGSYSVRYGTAMRAVRLAQTHHNLAIELIGLRKKYAPEDAQNKDDMRQIEARLLAERLRALYDENWPVWDRQQNSYRPFAYGDSAVLFRARRAMPIVEEAFKAANIPYVTVAGRGYYDRSEVRDILALLKALYNPADELSLAAALRSPLYGLSDDALYALRLLNPGYPFWQTVVTPPQPDQIDSDTVAAAGQSLTRLRMAVGRVPIAELILRILDETAFLATLSGLADGARRCGNVEKLIEKARRAGSLSLGDFLVLLQELSERELREGEAPVETGGAVNLMTIHASKGLEFPVVALFDAGDHREQTQHPLLYLDRTVGLACQVKNSADVDADEDETQQAKKKRSIPKPFAYRFALQQGDQREKAERLRLLYVAATRAADRLIVSGHLSEGKANWLNQLSAALGVNAPPVDSPGDSDDSIVVNHEWGQIRFSVPRLLPQPFDSTLPLSSTGWDQLTKLTVPPQTPPLAQAIPDQGQGGIDTLSATAVAMLGQVQAARTDIERERQAVRLRHRLLHDAPPPIREVAAAGTLSVRSRNRVVGEIVHKGLQFGLSASAANALETLAIYAWQLGLTEPTQATEAAKEALDLLSTAEQSEAIAQIGRAVQVYRELPFTLRWGNRAINGQIDVLYLTGRGQWTILDYKTDEVPPDAVFAHSRRYYGQLGIYSAAVQHITGQMPGAILYYIRPAKTVVISMDNRTEALSRLENEIQSVLFV